jgi:ribonuclease D
VISSDSQLAELLPRLRSIRQVAVDTEADSLHCYFEKLCLIQLAFEDCDYLVDPLAPLDLQPLCAVLAEKEIVLQGMDFDLRLLGRALNFVAREVFDTVIAARLLGLREFSLAALVQQFFGVTLPKGSQKANWARRPLPPVMEEYAKNDTHFLLPLAAKLEAQLQVRGRTEWFRQSCQRALEQVAVQRDRDPEEAWRIAGSGTLAGRTAALLRALWRWRDREAQQADRPSFHILQNSLLLSAAESFAAGEVPEFRHFSERRRRGFLAAAREALDLPESEWPQRRPRADKPRSRDFDQRVEELKRRRDTRAQELELEASFIAPRSALEAIAADETRTDSVLVEWQRELLNI